MNTFAEEIANKAILRSDEEAHEFIQLFSIMREKMPDEIGNAAIK